MAIKRKKGKIFDGVKSVAMGALGGYAGTKISDAVENSLSKGGNADANKIAPVVTGLIGVLGTAFAPDKFKAIFIGMGATAGAESLEKLEVSNPPTTTTTTQGVRIPAYSQNMNGVRVPAYNRINGYRTY